MSLIPIILPAGPISMHVYNINISMQKCTYNNKKMELLLVTVLSEFQDMLHLAQSLFVTLLQYYYCYSPGLYSFLGMLQMTFVVIQLCVHSHNNHSENTQIE